jgi:iron complex outermembrane recepter protein
MQTQFDLNDALNETADPRHQGTLRTSMNLPAHLDAALRWVDALHTNIGPVPGDVPPYVELDSRVGWHLSPRLELAVVGQNLLHAHHPEYNFPSPARVAIERSVHGKVAWRY